MAKTTPNLYEFSGSGITASYSTTSIDGKPRFSYNKGTEHLSFSGDEITALSTTIGTLVTVIIAKTVDRGFTSFSVLVPAILLVDNKQQAFQTIAITTVTTTTIAGPPTGPQQTYHTTHLHGTAQHVEF